MNHRSNSLTRLPVIFATLSAMFVFGCAAATPAAQWDATERGDISKTYPKCEFIEDEEAHWAGYSCEMGSFKAHDLPVAEDHTKITKRLADAKAEEPVTGKLKDIVTRDPITLDGQEFEASMASYEPEPGTIIPPELMMVLTPKGAPTKRAYACSITLMPGLDNADSIKGRIVACIDGLKMLINASKEAK